MRRFWVRARYLGFRDDGSVLRGAAVACGQRRRHDDGTGPDEPAEVTAGDLVLLLGYSLQIKDNGLGGSWFGIVLVGLSLVFECQIDKTRPI